MRHTGHWQNCRITKQPNSERGYILITLMLFVALLTIAALAILPEIAFQIKRDREEEMIHRAVQYSRAIRHFYKKFGRFPMRVEELEDTNHLRFLRKRYKDPITGEDFKLLRMGDPVLASLMLFGPGAAQALGQIGAPGVQVPNNVASGSTQPGAQPTQVTNVGSTMAVDNSNPPGGQTNSPGSSSQAGSSSGSDSGGNPPVYGGGPILGVVSTSKAKTIREFNNKNHYNDWLFVYDPSSDRGGMLIGPAQPNLNRGLGTTPAGGNTPGQTVPMGPQTQSGQPAPQGPPNPGSMPPEQ